MIQGPIPPPAVAFNILDEINRILLLLHDAGFVTKVLDAMKMLDYEQYRAMHAFLSLFEKLVLLMGKT